MPVTTHTASPSSRLRRLTRRLRAVRRRYASAGRPPRRAARAARPDARAATGRLASQRRAMAAGRGVSISPNVHVGPVGRLLVAIVNHYPRRSALTITSAYRPNRHSHHRGLTYHSGPTAAIDI